MQHSARHLLVVQLAAAAVAAARAPGAMARRPERLRHALGRARQHVRVRACGAAARSIDCTRDVADGWPSPRVSSLLLAAWRALVLSLHREADWMHCAGAANHLQRLNACDVSNKCLEKALTRAPATGHGQGPCDTCRVQGTLWCSSGGCSGGIRQGPQRARRTHGAADQHRLAGELVVDRDERVVRRERARAALAVHQQRLQLAVHDVLLHLRARPAR